MRPHALRSLLVLALPIAGLLCALAFYCHAQKGIREKEETLHAENVQIPALEAECGRLSNKVAQANAARFPTELQADELQRLKNEAGQLRQRAEDLKSVLEKSQDARKLLGAPLIPPGRQYTREELQMRNAIAAGKEQDAENLHWAFWGYYSKHHEQFPSSLDDLRPYLEQNHATLTGTNDFELIYPGPQDGLTNFPTQMLAVIRERQPWRAPSGRWARVYSMLTIPPRIVETDDDFQEWESEHVIPSR